MPDSQSKTGYEKVTTYGQIAPQDTNPGSGGPRIATPLAGLSVGDSTGES